MKNMMFLFALCFLMMPFFFADDLSDGIGLEVYAIEDHHYDVVMDIMQSVLIEADMGVQVEIMTPVIRVTAGQTAVLRVKFHIPYGYHQALQDDYFGIDLIETGGIVSGKTIYPAGGIVDDMGYTNYYESVILEKEIHVNARRAPGSVDINLLFFYQICENGGVCLAPEELPFEVVLEVLPSDFLGNRDNIREILMFILFGFIGGIILNLMPCVLPVLTIRAFALVKQSQESRQTILKNGILYTLGIMFSFMILATVIVIIKLSGEAVGWGFQFQNTGFVLVLLAVMFVFALSLFDAFVIQLPGMNAAARVGEKKGYWGSFLMGIFAVLIATPCTAPMLGPALGFAFSQTPSIIFAIFLAVGFGLGFPFLLISTFPATVRVLPKPGEWMNIFKEMMGFLLLGFAVKFMSVVQVQMGGDFIITRVLPYALALRIAIWVYGRWVTPLYSRLVQWIMAILTILIITFGAIYFFGRPYEVIESHSGEIVSADGFWVRFSERAVEEAQEYGVPVFIDFTAEYCLVCKQNEALVLNAADIRNAFTEKGVVMLKGDYTRRDPVIREWLRTYQRAGVPLYLLFIPGESEPVVFPEVLTKGMIFEALSRIPVLEREHESNSRAQ
jgi:thiol:disulfide interchange protein DsbD